MYTPAQYIGSYINGKLLHEYKQLYNSGILTPTQTAKEQVQLRYECGQLYKMEFVPTHEQQ